MKRIFYFLSVALIVSLAIGCLNTGEKSSVYEKNGYYRSKYAKICVEEWEVLNRGTSLYDGPEAFLDEVDSHVETFKDYLGVQLMPQVDERLVLGFRCSSRGNWYSDWVVFLDINDFRAGKSPLVHEITHHLATSESQGLTEGLAQFMEAKFGKQIPRKLHLQSVDLDGNVIQRTRHYVIDNKNDEYIAKNVGVPVWNSRISGGWKFYDLNHSFVHYLVEQYGIDKFMQVYRSRIMFDMYEQVYGLSLEQLREEWVAYVIDYPS